MQIYVKKIEIVVYLHKIYNMSIIFTDLDHSYKSGNIKYKSVSTIISEYKAPYDAYYWSLYKAYQKLLGEETFKVLKSEYKLGDHALFNYLKFYADQEKAYEIQASILDDWKNERDKSIVKGNNYHEFKEKQSFDDGYSINPFNDAKYETQKSVLITTDGSKELRTPTYGCLSDLLDGFHPELLLWNNKYQIAGQADKVYIETINGVRHVDIDDYKGFSLDTKIPTIDGWKLMNNIQEGDIIFDGKGLPTKVKHVSKIHYNPCFKIIFDNNSELICDHEHRWVISKLINNSKKKKKYNRENIEMTTEEIYNYYKNNDLKLAIEINKLQNISKTSLPISPYILGLWLADGNRTCGSITCTNNDIWEEIKNRGYELSNNRNDDTKACSRTIYNIYPFLKELNLLSNKHIPDIYLRSSYEDRLDLLRGYMDGDGHYNRKRNRYVMQTTSFKQAEDVQTLVCSLGYKCSIIKYKAKGFGKNVNAYSVSFRMKENPFIIRNKEVEKIVNYNYKNNFNYIKSIERVNTVPTKCIAVESNEKTYLVGNSLIMTHNTNKKISKTNIFQKMKDPISHLDDCNYNHYRLQISLYAWLLEQEGFIVRNLSFTHINKPYEFDYMYDEIDQILHHQTTLNNNKNYY